MSYSEVYDVRLMSVERECVKESDFIWISLHLRYNYIWISNATNNYYKRKKNLQQKMPQGVTDGAKYKSNHSNLNGNMPLLLEFLLPFVQIFRTSTAFLSWFKCPHIQRTNSELCFRLTFSLDAFNSTKYYSDCDLFPDVDTENKCSFFFGCKLKMFKSFFFF